MTVETVCTVVAVLSMLGAIGCAIYASGKAAESRARTTAMLTQRGRGRGRRRGL